MPTQMSQPEHDVADVLKFESWLRFYFIIETEDGGLLVRIPEKAVEQIRTLHPELVELALSMNEQTIDQESSQRNVCLFAIQNLDGKKYPYGTTAKAFDGKHFKNEMYLFNLWQQAHESQLDATFTDFNGWKRLFEEWKRSPQVQEYFGRLAKSPSPSDCGTTVQ